MAVSVPAVPNTGPEIPAAGRRLRGQGRQPLWQRPEQVSVIVLPLMVDGIRQRRRLEKLFAAMHSIRRALQREVGKRMRAYWASPRRLQQDATEWREQLGLDREGLEGRAYHHLERSRWMLGHLSKALAMHQADEVWVAVARHVFGDWEGKRSGMPRVGSYWDYLRIAGRARSHTTERKWETFRLFGTLEGHLAAYRHPELPAQITSPLQAAGLAPGSHVLAQPRHPRLPSRPASWGTTRVPWCWSTTVAPAPGRGSWSCRYGCLKGRAAGPIWSTTWIAQSAGISWISCGGGMPRPKEAGPTRRI